MPFTFIIPLHTIPLVYPASPVPTEYWWIYGLPSLGDGVIAEQSDDNGCSAVDNLDGTATITISDAVIDGVGFDYFRVIFRHADRSQGINTFPFFYVNRVFGASYPFGAARDENYTVTLYMTGTTGLPDGYNLWDSSNLKVDFFVIDWGDGTVESAAPDSENYVTGGYGGGTGDTYTATLTKLHTFSGPASSTGISVTLNLSSQDWVQLGNTFLIPPRAKFSVTQKGRSVSLNASESDDIDGTIVDYAWNYGGAGNESGTPPIEPNYTYDHYGAKSINLIVTDNDGLTDSATMSVTIQWANRAAALDVHGRIWAAAPSTGDPARKVRCYWHPADLSKFKEGVSMLRFEDSSADEYAVAALWFDNAGALWALLYNVASDVTAALYLGHNYPEFQSEVGGEILDETQILFNGCEVREGEAALIEGDIRGATGCALQEGGHVVAGVDFDTLEIKVARTLDGINASNWSAPFVVDTLADGDSVDLALFQQSAAGSSQLVLLHPHSARRWVSGDFGANWDETTAP